MAQRDYVKNRSSAKTKRRSSSKVPTLMIILAAGVLLAFVAILYFVAHNNKPAVKVKPPKESSTQSSLPARPEERWSYIKELENRDVMSGKDFESDKKLTAEQRQILQTMQADRPVHQQHEQIKGSWSIQCGSFKALDGADAIKAQLALAGHDSKILTSNGWYRVVLGPYQQKNQANSIITQLKGVGISSCIVLASGG